MAKGQILKDQIEKKILEVFPDAFVQDKKIYINGKENGESVQVALSMTCPKTPVGAPVKMDFETDWEFDGPAATPAPPQKQTEITQSERENILELMRKLNL